MNRIARFACLVSVGSYLSITAATLERFAGITIRTQSEVAETLRTDSPGPFEPGAKITTAKGANGLIRQEGFRFYVGENSEIVNAGDALQLESGSVFGDGSNAGGSAGLLLKAGDVQIVGAGARFGARVQPGAMISVAVIGGSVELRSGQGNLVLEKGKKVRKPLNGPFEAVDTLNPGEWAALNRMAEATSPAAPDSGKPAAAASDSSAVSARLAAEVAVAPVSAKVPVDTAKPLIAAKASASSATTPDTARSAKIQDAAPAQAAKPAQPSPGATVPIQPEPAATLEIPSENIAQPAVSPEEKPDGEKEGVRWEIGLASVTIDGRQWQRISISPDIPLWKFGLCLDLEIFIDDSGSISDKGWRFSDVGDVFESLARKIRYVRFAKSGDPFYVKLGALDNVTLGYGFIASGFTNTLQYPEFKKLGLDLELNGLSSLQFSLHGFTHDLRAISDGATVAGIRAAVRPLAPTPIPVLRGLEIGVTAAGDENQYGGLRDFDRDGVPDAADDYPVDKNLIALADMIDPTGLTPTQVLAQAETLWARQAAESDLRKREFGRVDQMIVGGLDVGVPVISSSLLQLTVYGQYARNFDSKDASDTMETEGWGIAAPGAQLKMGPFSAQAEFRHIEGQFQASYFGGSYERERIVIAGNRPIVKENTLDSVSLNGIFASFKALVGPVATIGASYEHLIAKEDSLSQKGLTGNANLGEIIVKRIPKLASAGAYFSKSRIGQAPIYDSTGTMIDRDDFFGRSPYMMFGYQVGFALTENLVLTWDKRYAYRYNEQYQLTLEPKIYIQTALRF